MELLLSVGVTTSQTRLGDALNFSVGWNFFAYKGISTPLPFVLSQIDGKYTLVAHFENGVWRTFDPTAPSALNSLDELTSGAVYVLNMSEPATVAFEASPVGGFAVVQSASYMHQFGIFYIVGEIRNDNPFSVRLVEVKATLYDTNDTVLGAGFTFACLNMIPSGGDSPFDLRIINPPEGIARYTLAATGLPTVEPAPTDLTVAPFIAQHFEPEAQTYHVSGLVGNESSAIYDNVKVCGALYDEQGKIIRAGYGLTEPSTLKPGDLAGFDYADFDVISPPTGYRLWADGVRR